MENKEIIRAKLKEQGYSQIHEYKDPPNLDFTDHDHEADQLLYVVNGSMIVKMNNKETILTTGDEFFFPAKVIHSARTGPDGCESIVGEKS